MTLYLEGDLLRAYEALSRCDVSPRFEPGDRLVRGFADVGYEKFVILPNGHLLSLLRGTTTTLPIEERRHFFGIFDVLGLVDILEQRGWIVRELAFLPSRKVQARAQRGDEVREGVERTPEQALIALILGGPR